MITITATLLLVWLVGAFVTYVLDSWFYWINNVEDEKDEDVCLFSVF